MPPKKAKRPPAFERKLARIRELRAAERPSTEELAELLADREPYLAGQAAEVIGELGAREHIANLAAALCRIVAGQQPDDGCMASHPVARALTRLEADAPEAFRRGLGYFRPERVGPGPPVDRAVPVRIECAIGLARQVARGALLDLAPLLADPEAPVRAGVARALAVLPGDGPPALLHLTLLSGERDADVLGACMAGLLDLDADRYLPLVQQRLLEEGMTEVAAIALGESRRAEALPALRHALEQLSGERELSAVTLAMALLRLPQATDALVELIDSGPDRVAAAAVRALAVHRHVTAVAERVAAAVRTRGSARVAAAHAESFGA